MAQTRETDDDDAGGMDDPLDAEIRALLAAPPVEPEALLERIAPARLAVGTRVDDAFVIERRIAQGGMGVVYLARHELLDRAVAIKLCRRRASGAQTQRLLREARAMAALDHPNVVKVHHVGMFDEQVYIAMEFVEGGTLGRWCAQAPRSATALIERFVEAGRGLQAAHAQGFVHRDFKPENVLMGSDGRARVGDFGLVSPDRMSTAQAGGLASGDSGHSTLSFAGTPHYMAPEQRAGAPVGPAADQYALCLSLQEALDDARGHAARLGEAWPSPSRGVQAALLRGLQRDPADRHRDMGALLGLLAPARWLPTRATALGGLATLGIVAVGTWWASSPTAVACPSAQPRIAQVWSPMRADAVVRAAPELADAQARALLTEGFDRFSAQWTGAYAQTCDAAVFPTPPLRVEARACLEEALAQFDAVLDAMVDAGPSGEVRAMQGLYALPRLARCYDVAQLQRRLQTPRTAVEARRAAALGIELGRIRAWVGMGLPHPDVARMDQAIADAEDLRDRSALAWALMLRARMGAPLPSGSGPPSAWLERALGEAEAAGDDRLRAAIGAHLVVEVGVNEGRHGEGLAWASRTEAVLERLGDLGRAEAAALYDSLGALHLGSGRLEAATDALQRAERLKLELLGAEHPSTSSTRLTLGRVWIRRREHARAREVLDAAHRGYVAAGDVRHLGFSRTQVLLAELAEERTDDGEAQRLLTEVLQRWEAEFGLDHPRLIRALNSLGRVRARGGDSDGALAAYGRAREIAVRSLGPDDAHTGWALGNEAEGFLVAGAHAAAIDGFSAAIEHLRAQPGAAGLDSDALAGRAEAYLATGRVWAAREDAQRVLAQCDAQCDPGIVARASLTLADALNTHGEHAQAVALLETALDELPNERRTHRILRRSMLRWLEEQTP